MFSEIFKVYNTVNSVPHSRHVTISPGLTIPIITGLPHLEQICTALPSISILIGASFFKRGTCRLFFQKSQAVHCIVGRKVLQRICFYDFPHYLLSHIFVLDYSAFLEVNCRLHSIVLEDLFVYYRTTPQHRYLPCKIARLL